MVVGCHYDFSRSQFTCSSLELSNELVSVCPDFKVMGQHFMLCIEVFDKDYFFFVVSVPPFIAHFEIAEGVFFSGLSGFSGSRGSTIPFHLGRCVGVALGEEMSVSVGLDGSDRVKSYVIRDVFQSSVFCGEADFLPLLFFSFSREGWGGSYFKERPVLFTVLNGGF